MKNAFLAFLFATAALRATPPPASPRGPQPTPALSDYETVRRAGEFYIATPGPDSRLSPAESAFRRILASSTASNDCRKLLAHGTIAGQLYGLLGLKLLGDVSYFAASGRYRASQVHVDASSVGGFGGGGCVRSPTTVSQVAANIYLGVYQ